MKAIRLKPGREKSVLQYRPWIFSGAVDRVEGGVEAGDVVDILSSEGKRLGRAGFSPDSQIRARMWTWDPDETVDEVFIQRRLENAMHYRKMVVLPEEGNAYRLVHGESDGFPGLVVDRYADTLVIQFLSAGAEGKRGEIVNALREGTGIQDIYERSDVDVRKLEGLPERTGTLSGNPPEVVEIMENGIRFLVNIRTGQKTGFYLDQRRNRAVVGKYAKGRRVLNCFCYTGGFTAYSHYHGVDEILSVDSSGEAIRAAMQNMRINGFPDDPNHWLEADVFTALRKFRDQGRVFDMILLDPPKFAQTAAQAERAARGYKDINLLAFKLLSPGGLLVTFSCSGGISAELFQKIIAGAAVDARVGVRIVEKLTQAPDHPVGIHFPEGEYLKGLVCSIT